MITFSKTQFNNFLEEVVKNNEKYVNTIKLDINKLKEFSNILDIISITKVNDIQENYDILYFIKTYEIMGKINNYEEYQCPNCKRRNCLHFHKNYERNITFFIGNYKVEAIITLLVLECNYCKNYEDEQRYHAILLDFIFPYHTYSANIILNTIYGRLINKIKVEQIIEKNKITKELYYKWVRGFKKYSMSADTILGIGEPLELIIKAIVNDIHTFLYRFYQTYYHPFFLFRSTCVPLSIIP